MDQKTLRLTYGAMAVAIFGLMLFLNRQTGTLFEEFLLFVYPLPMVAYAALYGFGSGFAALLAMAFISFFFGDIISIFYAIAQAVTGWIFGGCLHRRVDQTKTLFLVMLLSVIMNLVDIIFMSFLSGMDLTAEIYEMQTMISELVSMFGINMPQNLLSFNYLRQMFIICMAVMGVLQGFVVYELSILILRRLRFPVPKLKNIFLYRPPGWSGLVALLALMLYFASLSGSLGNEILDQTALTVGILGYVYLIFFGFLCAMLTMRAYVTHSAIICTLVCVILFLCLPFVLIVAGIIYLCTGFHSHLLSRMGTGSGEMNESQKNR